MSRPTLLLASASPRRAEILAQIGLPYRRATMAAVNEDHPEPSPERLVRHLAELKCRAVIFDAEQPVPVADTFVLGADTVVVIDGMILGKPRDASDAARMIAQLAGRRHRVFTGLALAEVISDANGRASLGRMESLVASTEVNFASLDAATIAAYVATGEPLDKAGAYGIQGPGAMLIEGVVGEYYTVMGLSVRGLVELFARFGRDLGELL